MGIDMNWPEVRKVGTEVRTQAENAVKNINQRLGQVGKTVSANPGFDTSAALPSCESDWSDELSDLVRRTMIAASKLDHSSWAVNDAEEENRQIAESPQDVESPQDGESPRDVESDRGAESLRGLA